MGFEEGTMILSVQPNEETFMPEITLTLPSDGFCITVPLCAFDAARLGGYLVQAALGVDHLSKELEGRDLAEREEIMALYLQYQEPAVVRPQD